MRREAAKRLALLETRHRAAAGDAVDWSAFSTDELAEIRRWCEACGDRPLIEWTDTLSEDERWRVRGVLLRIAEQARAA